MSATGGGSGRGPGGAPRRFVAPVARYAGAGVFLALGFPLGVFWFTALLTLGSLGVSLIPILVGFPILALTALVWTLAARIERWWVGLLLGVRVPSPYRRPPPGASRLLRFRTRLLDPALRRDLLYVLLLFPVGIVQLVVVLLAFFVTWTLISYPLRFEPQGGGGEARTSSRSSASPSRRPPGGFPKRTCRSVPA